MKCINSPYYITCLKITPIMDGYVIYVSEWQVYDQFQFSET